MKPDAEYEVSMKPFWIGFGLMLLFLLVLLAMVSRSWMQTQSQLDPANGAYIEGR